MSSLSTAGTAAAPAKGGAAPAAPAGGGAGGGAPAASAAPGKQSFAPLPRSGAPIQVATSLELDGRTLGRAVTRHQLASAETRNGTGQFDDQGLKTPVGSSAPLVPDGNAGRRTRDRLARSAMPSLIVTLGGFTFRGHEVSDHIPFESRQILAKHVIIGG